MVSGEVLPVMNSHGDGGVRLQSLLDEPSSLRVCCTDDGGGGLEGAVGPLRQQGCRKDAGDALDDVRSTGSGEALLSLGMGAELCRVRIEQPFQRGEDSQSQGVLGPISLPLKFGYACHRFGLGGWAAAGDQFPCGGQNRVIG